MKINNKFYLSGILIFGLFMATLHPTITAGDSGEIVAAAFSLGIPHPPGYPLYVTIGKLFTLVLPLGNAAYRVNIASAAFGALSCVMVYLITRRIVQGIEGGKMSSTSQPLNFSTSYLPSLFASLSLALSSEFWHRSTVAEVYTLNVFLMLLTIYVLLVWRERGISGQGSGVGDQGSEVPTQLLNFSTSQPPIISRLTSHDSRLLYLSSFLIGLGTGNHHTIALLIPGALLFALWNVWRSSGPPSHLPTFSPSSHCLTSHVSRLMFFFLLGLSIYLYLPLRSFKNPFMDWGDPQGLHNFIDVFTRRSYLPTEVERGWVMLVEQLKTFNPIHEFTFMGFLFGLLGAWSLWKSERAIATMLLTTLILASYGLILLAGSSTKDVDILKKFYLPAYTLFSIFMGVGAATAAGFRGSEVKRLRSSEDKKMSNALPASQLPSFSSHV